MCGEKEPLDVEREDAPSSACRGGGDAFPAPVDASASAARRPSVPRLWSPSDGWPTLPGRFPRSPQSGILQSL